jgi:hypothetical protein
LAPPWVDRYKQIFVCGPTPVETLGGNMFYHLAP